MVLLITLWIIGHLWGSTIMWGFVRKNGWSGCGSQHRVISHHRLPSWQTLIWEFYKNVADFCISLSNNVSIILWLQSHMFTSHSLSLLHALCNFVNSLIFVDIACGVCCLFRSFIEIIMPLLFCSTWTEDHLWLKRHVHVEGKTIYWE